MENDAVIDLANFYTLIGAPHNLGADEQLMLPGDVRVQVTPSGWTVFFEALQLEGSVLSDAFAISQQEGSAVPFLTRSGYLGMKWQSSTSLPDTSEAMRVLQAVLRQMAKT